MVARLNTYHQTKGEPSLWQRALFGTLAVVVAYAVIRNLPDVARYIKRSEICERTHSGEQLRHSRVLIAGVENIFLGDDGFGVEVAKRLASAVRS